MQAQPFYFLWQVKGTRNHLPLLIGAKKTQVLFPTSYELKDAGTISHFFNKSRDTGTIFPLLVASKRHKHYHLTSYIKYRVTGNTFLLFIVNKGAQTQSPHFRQQIKINGHYIPTSYREQRQTGTISLLLTSK
jgi:hypothetical protein